jgi:DNA-binding transcriptional LysR family regulator
MDLRQLEIIRAIADTGSFTGAGERLGVSQSAVSRQVLLLEEELGEPVFLRVGRRVKITPSGEALLQLSHRIFQDLHDTVAGITEARQTLRGTLHIVGGTTVGLFLFPTLVATLREAHPALDVRLTSASDDQCLALIRKGTADLGLLTEPIEDLAFVTQPAFEEAFVLVTGTTHPLARRRRVKPHDLRHESFLVYSPGANVRRIVNELFVREQLEPVIISESDNTEIIKALVKTGAGIAILPYQAVANESRETGLVVSQIHGVELVRRVAWVYPKTGRVPKAVRAALETFEQLRPRWRFAP